MHRFRVVLRREDDPIGQTNDDEAAPSTARTLIKLGVVMLPLALALIVGIVAVLLFVGLAIRWGFDNLIHFSP